MSEIVKSPQFGHKSPVEDEEKINKPEQPKSDELNNNNNNDNNEHVVIYRTTSTQNSNKNDSFDIIELPQTSKDEMNGNLTDPITEILVPVKSLDPNRYATKKTIAQGMLDIALLTANASQLKYILQVGKQHEFYTLMLTLICISIGLQILSGLLSLSLNLMTDRNMQDSRQGYTVEWIGRIRVALSFIVFLDNILIATFDPMGLSSLIAIDSPIDNTELIN
ncbi:ninjurin-1-like isoform X2 [Microplitis mediator]|uniref:ninjurin-1-like isoform X2 n=2 Tax=Microplitis mediator TaxID=375433 RepID=UPI0025557028|nr:ninjurin-1-like isoform X2 [Microplitis mediator]